MGECAVPCTGAYDHCGYCVATCDFGKSFEKPKLDMRLRFRKSKRNGDEKAWLRIHWFKFT